MRFRHKMEIVAACAILPCVLELFPASRVLERVRRVKPRRGDALGAARLAHHVDHILARGRGPWRYTCLRRAVVLAALLRRDGRDAEVVFGVRRRRDGSLEAHAWLRCDGEEPFLEHGEVTAYEALTSRPPDAQRGPR